MSVALAHDAQWTRAETVRPVKLLIAYLSRPTEGHLNINARDLGFYAAVFLVLGVALYTIMEFATGTPAP